LADFIIKSLKAREILDSRGNPTVEVEAFTRSGFGRASVPSGASTGTYEAVELRDGGSRFHGKGVLKACRNVDSVLAPAVVGMDSRNLHEIDRKMISLDGTENKSRLGANAILGASLAVAKAAADTAELSLFKYLNPDSYLLPVPLMNIINGGKHAGNSLAIQEFMVVPLGAKSMKDALRIGSEVYMELKKLLKDNYGPSAINVGDEGGFAPPITDSSTAFGSLIKAIKGAGYTENDVKIAIDPAATSFYGNGKYSVDGETLTAEALLVLYEKLVDEYPIISIEDPFEEDDYSSFVAITKSLGKKVQIVGDDIFVTNIKRFAKGAAIGAANSLLLKVNQIGTLTEAIEVAKYAFSKGYTVVVSHRSGETEDCYIADLAVALNTGQIKAGAPARGERISKYNQLIRIEELLGSKARYPGKNAFNR
jgi:enolase